MHKDGRNLSVARTGGTILKRSDAGKSVATAETIIAEWQCPVTNTPERCVIRCDGRLQDKEPVGYPCGVLRIDYSIGGFQVQTCYIDCVNQSALVVWANSIEVIPVWDERRIERLAAFFNGLEVENPGIISEQKVAASITVEDTGVADARWLDVITFNNTDDATSIHPIPPGARGCRFLNSTLSGSGDIAPISDYLTRIRWAATADDSTTFNIHQDAVPSDSCALDVPAGTTHLFLDFTAIDATLTTPFWVEWIMSPVSL